MKCFGLIKLSCITVLNRINFNATQTRLKRLVSGEWLFMKAFIGDWRSERDAPGVVAENWKHIISEDLL